MRLKYEFADASAAEARCVVYALTDPRTQQVRYVGKTAGSLKKRIQDHLSEARDGRTKKNRWLKGLLQRGCVVVVDVLETCFPTQLNESERYWISCWRFMGARLVNDTDGGDGVVGHRLTNETRKRMSETHKRRPREPRSDAHRVAISRGKGGRPIVDDLGNRYETMAQAARSVGVAIKYVSAVVHGRVFQVHGRRFKFEGSAWPVVRAKGRPLIDDEGVVYLSLSHAAAALQVSLAAVSLAVNGKRRTVRKRQLRWVF